MNFENWYFLLLIPGLLVVFQWIKRVQQPTAVPYSFPIPQELRVTNPTFFLNVMRMMGLGLLIFSLSRPQKISKYVER